MNITISTGNFYYFDWNLEQIIKFCNGLDNISGLELHIPHNYIFSQNELKLLNNFKMNSIHLHGITNINDINFLNYCKNTIPNFTHGVVHPNDCNFSIIDGYETLISIENMDKNKNNYQKASQLTPIFSEFSQLKFTYDINHAMENGLNDEEFHDLPFPYQIHYSALNNNYYEKYQTPHSMVIFNKNFKFPIQRYKEIIITLEGLFISGKEDLIQKEIDNLQKLIK